MNETGRREIIVTQLVFIVLVGTACYVSPTTYVRFIAEDYWGEYGTWAAFMIAAGLFVSCFHMARGDWLARAWYVVLSIACFFVAMEEISWGQRVLGLSMPETLARLNNQYELTLHNLAMIERVTPYDTVVPIAVLTYGVLLAFADTFFERVRHLLARLRVIFPPLYLAPTFLLSAILVSAPVEKSSELGELLAGIGMVLLAASHAHMFLGKRTPTPKIRRWIVGGFFGLLVLYLVGAFLLMPMLIKAAYNGQSFDVINNILSGRSVHPVEKYLAEWAAVRSISLVLLLIAAGVAVPFVRRLWSPAEERSWVTRATGPILITCISAAGFLFTGLTGPTASFGFELNALADRVAQSGYHERAASILTYIEEHSLAPRPDVLYRRALVYQDSGRQDEAASLFEEALVLESAALREDSSPARAQRLGEISAKLGRSGDAEEYWKQALTMHSELLRAADSNEERTVAHLGRAATYRLMQDHNAAISEYVRASTVVVLGFRKKHIWLGIGEVLAVCQSDDIEKGPRWDFGVHWDRVQRMRNALENGPAPAWCLHQW